MRACPIHNCLFFKIYGLLERSFGACRCSIFILTLPYFKRLVIYNRRTDSTAYVYKGSLRMTLMVITLVESFLHVFTLARFLQLLSKNKTSPGFFFPRSSSLSALFSSDYSRSRVVSSTMLRALGETMHVQENDPLRQN